MPFSLGSLTVADVPAPTTTPVPEEEEYYSSWSLFLVCMLLVLSLWTSYYLQIKRIRAINETIVSIFAGMFVGLVVRLTKGDMIREMLVSVATRVFACAVPRATKSASIECWLTTLPSSSAVATLALIQCHPTSDTSLTIVTPGIQTYALLQPAPSAHHPQLWL
jgi:hypothetical protein